jgi:hypothetical protein
VTTVDLIVKWLVYLTAPAQTAFILLYGFGSPWWRTLLGRALFTKALGLALLLDLALLFQVYEGSYAYRDAARLSVFSLIALGAWLQLAALIKERVETYRENKRPEL